MKELDYEIKKFNTYSKPKFIYKYHQMNIHLMELLTNAEFYMSKKTELNDPLDSVYTISLENYLKLYFKKHPFLYDDKEHLSRLTFIFNHHMETGSSEWMNDIDELQTQLRVCCFTEDGNNPLMWSHYAANHTGVCLKFELANDNNLEKMMFPVVYANELIDAKEEEDFSKCLLSKLNAWNIEREWRIISNKEKFRFKQEALVEITFGIKVPDSNMNWFAQFRENVYYMHAPVYKLKIRGNRLVKVDRNDEEVIDNV